MVPTRPRGPGVAGGVGPAQPLLGRAVQHVHTQRIARLQRVGAVMTFVECSEPLFQCVCRLNRSARKGVGPEMAQVRSELKGVVAECRVRANQNPESPVSTRPLSGISVASTTSKVEMRSLATSSSRPSSSS